MTNTLYPRPHDRQIVYLKDVITGPNIVAGDSAIYNDFVHDPREFEKNNVLYLELLEQEPQTEKAAWA